MKRYLLVLVSVINLLNYTACTKVDSVDVQEESKPYTKVSFSELPVEGSVELDGYISSISNDYTSGYLFNTCNGDVSYLNSMDYYLALKFNPDDDSVLQGYYTVCGTLQPNSEKDSYGIVNDYVLVVDNLVELTELPNNIKEYESFVDSQQAEALLSTLNYVGSVLYNSMQEDESDKLEISDVGCYFTKLMRDTKEEYPSLYDVIKNYLEFFNDYYSKVKSDCLEELVYGDFIEQYNDFVLELDKFAEFE